MPCKALIDDPKAQINPAISDDVLNDDWVIPCLDGTSDSTKQAQAFDQIPLVKMKPPQPYQILS